MFLILGSVWEVFPILGEVNMIDMGSVFLFCAVMFPTQMLISLDISEMAQTSPYKKALQTSIPAKISACGGLLMLAWATLLKGIAYATGNISGNLGWQLLQIGIWMFFLMIFNGVCYKFFIISLIIMYSLMFGLGMSAGMASFGKRWYDERNGSDSSSTGGGIGYRIDSVGSIGRIWNRIIVLQISII